MSIRKWLWLMVGALFAAVLTACGGGGGTTAPVVPATPTQLSAVAADAQVTTSWAAVPGATSYNLYWSDTSPVTTSSNKLTGVTAPFVHTGLTNGKLYYYAVSAVNDAGESALSGEVAAMPTSGAPAAPQVFNATPGDAQVMLAWQAVPEATSYNLYWSTSTGVAPGGAGVTKIAAGAVTAYTHLGLVNGTTYYYVLTAVSADGESAPSAEVSATPQAPVPGTPQNLSATSHDAHVHLAWSPSQDATSYNVYWAKTTPVQPGGAGVSKIAGITTTEYTHEGLTNGDTYYYAVSSVSPGGESPVSATVSARPLPIAPPAPTGLTAIAARDSAQVTVQWFDITNYPSAAAPVQPRYNLYRGTTAGLASYYKDPARATLIANVTAPYLDAALTTNTTYYYVVTAAHPTFPEVEGPPSSEIAVTTARAGGGGSGGSGGEESFGSNLSFPLVFADGYGFTGLPISGTWPGTGPFTPPPAFDYSTGLRPLSTETLTTFPWLNTADAVSIGGTTYYPQGTASTWQAEWRNNATGAPMDVIVDWGDALLSKTYTSSSLVRIETVLKQDATVPGVTDTMTAYRMALISGTGITELQGTSGVTYASATRNVFAINARLKIEKLTASGDVEAVVYDKAVYEGFGATEEEGGGSSGGSTALKPYAVEINQGGSAVYGLNFRVSAVSGVAKTGQYRITFSLDPQATVGTTTVPNHVKMIGKADAGANLAADGLSSSVVITVN